MPKASTDWMSLFSTEQLDSDIEFRKGDESDSEFRDGDESDSEQSSTSDGIASPCPSDSDEEYVAEDDADSCEEEEDKPTDLPAPQIQTGKTKPKPKAVDGSTTDLRYQCPAYRSDINPIPNFPGVFGYTVHIPIHAQKGLQIEVSQGSGGVVFYQYRRADPNIMGPAEQKRVFISQGDCIVAVDGVDCRQKPFGKVVELLGQRLPPTAN